MNPRAQLYLFYEDIAKRNVDVAHTPTDADGTRFFLEQEYNLIQGGGQLQNLGWNMLVEGYDGRDDDNRHSSNPLYVRGAFSILTHCEREDSAAHTAAYNAAFLIGWEILNHMDHVCQNRANAVSDDLLSAGINIPSHIIRKSIEFLDVGPRFDQYYGMRFQFDLRQHCDLSIERDPDKWRSLT